MPDGGREVERGGREGRKVERRGRMECTSKPGLSIYLSVKFQPKNETKNHNTHTYIHFHIHLC